VGKFDEQYDKLSAWFKEREVSRGTLTVEGIEFPYVVCRRDPAAPRWFVGLDSGSGVYFISEEVESGRPDELTNIYRELVLRHEMFELGINKGEGVGRCERALRYELAHCPLELYGQYVLFRLAMFEALLEWIKANPKGYSPEQIREMQYTRDWLVCLFRKL